MTTSVAPAVALCAALALALVLAVAPPARGQVPPLPLPPAPPSTTAVIAGHLAQQLVTPGAPPEPASTIAIEVAVRAPAAGAQPRRLAAFVADSLEAALRARVPLGARLAAGHMGQGGQVGPQGRGAALRFTVTLSLAGGRLDATAERRRMPATVWEQLRAPAGQVEAAAFASERADLEVRTLLGLGPQVVKFGSLKLRAVTRHSDPALVQQPVLDLLVADLDDDRTPELVVLQRDLVLVARWRGAGFGPAVAVATLGTLPPNPARVREPFGRLVLVTRPDGGRWVVAASSEQARPAVLVFTGAALEAVGGGAPALGWPLYALDAGALVTAPWPRGTDVLQGIALRQRVGAGADLGDELLELAPVHDLRAFGLEADASPSWAPALAQASVGGALEVRDAGRTAQLRGHGLAMAVADMDRDGQAELLTTSDALAGDDRLTLYQLGETRAPRVLWRHKTAAAITALACGDVDRDGHVEYVVATWHGRRGGLALVPPVMSR